MSRFTKEELSALPIAKLREKLSDRSLSNASFRNPDTRKKEYIEAILEYDARKVKRDQTGTEELKEQANGIAGVAMETIDSNSNEKRVEEDDGDGDDDKDLEISDEEKVVDSPAPIEPGQRAVFDEFVRNIKASYSEACNPETAELESHESERKLMEKHNQYANQLFDAAQQIQACDTLTAEEKLARGRQLCSVAFEWHQLQCKHFEFDVPDQFFDNQDGSRLLESSLKQFRVPTELLRHTVRNIHNGKLKISDPMTVMMYTASTLMNLEMLNKISRAYHFACNVLVLRCSPFGEDGDVDDEAVDADVDDIVRLLEQSMLKTHVCEARPRGCSDDVRFDADYQTRDFFVDRRVEQVYSARLDRNEMWTDVADIYRMDISRDLFSVCGGTGWKYRDPASSHFLIGDTGKPKSIGCDWGFSSPGRVVYCDSMHRRVWCSGDRRIKCSGVIEAQSNATTTTNKRRKSNCDYILDVSRGGSLFTTNEAVLLYSHGQFFRWSWNTLMTHKTDYFTQSCDDATGIPVRDENGIATQQRKLFQNTMSDLEDVEVEVSGGQKHESVFAVDGIVAAASDTSSIAIDADYAGASRLYFTANNGVYLYDLNETKVTDVLVGHRGSSALAFRQNLTATHDLLVSHDAQHAKVWDLRTCSAMVSVNACGRHRVNSCMGMNVAGNAFLATGGSDECVTVWDLRQMKRALYEISTGNNTVRQILFHEASQSLFVATDCLYVDRHGYKHYDLDFSARNGYEDYDSDDEDWPARAAHSKQDFPSEFDAGENALFRIKFQQ